MQEVSREPPTIRFDFVDSWWKDCPEFTQHGRFGSLSAEVLRACNKRKMIQLEMSLNDASKRAYRSPLFAIIGLFVFFLFMLLVEEETHQTVFVLLMLIGLLGVFIAPIVLFKMYIKRLKREIEVLNDLHVKEGIRFHLDGNCSSLTNYGICFRGSKRILTVIVTIVPEDNGGLV